MCCIEGMDMMKVGVKLTMTDFGFYSAFRELFKNRY